MDCTSFLGGKIPPGFPLCTPKLNWATLSLLDACDFAEDPGKNGCQKHGFLRFPIDYRCWMLGSFQYSHYRTKVRNLEEQCLQRCNAEAKKVRPSSRCSHCAFSGLDWMFTSAMEPGMGCYAGVSSRWGGKKTKASKSSVEKASQSIANLVTWLFDAVWGIWIWCLPSRLLGRQHCAQSSWSWCGLASGVDPYNKRPRML